MIINIFLYYSFYKFLQKAKILNMNNYSFFHENNVKKYFKFLQKKMQNMITNNL